jgi:hypothetical protein
MGRFKATALGGKKVMMAFDGSGWRILASKSDRRESRAV